MKQKWILLTLLVLTAIVATSVSFFLIGPESLSEERLSAYSEPEHRQVVHYSELKNLLTKNSGEDVYRITVQKVNNEPTSIVVRFKVSESNADLIAELPSILAEEEIRQFAENHRIEYTVDNTWRNSVDAESGQNSTGLPSGLSFTNLVMIGIFGTMLYIMWQQYRSGPGGASKLTKSKHKKFEAEKGVVKFSDVAGLDELEDDMKMLVEFLKDPAEIKNLGGKIAKATLLVGPPGTGKTLIAKAVAGEAGVPAFYINASEFVEMYVGVGAARVRDMFSEIRKNLPCILIIDELDAVAQHRGTGIGGGNDERQQTINQLLTEMDGFENNEGLIVFGLTNRPDVLDPAITRSGRFGDRRATVGMPDRKARREIIGVHSRGLKLDASVDLDELARATSGLSGADIHSILKIHGPHFAIKRAREAGKVAETIRFEDFEMGISEVITQSMATKKKSGRLSLENKLILAFHELGHALVGEYLYRLSTDWRKRFHAPVGKVTIIGAGNAGGYTLFQENDDFVVRTKENLIGMIATAVAGNKAEEMFLGTTTTGASNDIERAYDLARSMVTKWGMSDLGLICAGGNSGNPFLGKKMSQGGDYGMGPLSSNQIDQQIMGIMHVGGLVAASILQVAKPVMQNIAPVLVEEETLLRDRFVELLERADLVIDLSVLKAIDNETVVR